MFLVSSFKPYRGKMKFVKYFHMAVLQEEKYSHILRVSPEELRNMFVILSD
jgi:hypothetical protein